MKIAVVGAGALGLYYGALLQRSGQEVHFLLRRDYAAVTEHGLRVFSVKGDFYLPEVAGHRFSAEIGPVDLVIVGLKTFANDSLGALVGPLVGEGTQILTLQNGLGNEEALAALFSADRIVGGVAFLCCNRGEPGTVHHLGAGRIMIGEFRRHEPARLDRITGLFTAAGVDCRPVGDLARARWEKLVWNIPFNGLCALLGLPVDRLLAVPATRKLVKGLMTEVVAAANAQDLTGPIPADFVDAMIEFTDAMGTYRPSMQIDREEGRPLETGAIFRIPLEMGQTRGVAMPRVEMLATLLEQAVSAPAAGAD